MAGKLHRVFVPRSVLAPVLAPVLALVLGCTAAHEHSVAAPALHSAPIPVPRLVDTHLDFLASDDLGGRETGTVQSLITGQYVASVFRAAGLVPGGDDGDYLQSYPMEADHPKLDSLSLLVRSADGASSWLAAFDDYVLRGLGSTGATLTSGVVFAGYGIVSEKEGVDEYAGLDVDGHWVLVLDGRPPERPELRVASNWRAKRDAAQAAGAAGMLVVPDESSDSARRYLDAIGDAMREARLTVPRDDEQPEQGWPMVWLRASGAAALADAGGLDLAAERAERVKQVLPGRALDRISVALVAPVERERTHAYNILGLLPGSDPKLAHEVVIVTAHNDHIGILPDGRINNGADDNGTGTTTLLTTAQVLAGLPAPRRTVLFLSVSGEEKGLLGSEWWVDHPTLPLADCVADINIDMVGRNAPLAVGITPSPTHEDYNSMVPLAVTLGEQVGLHVDYSVPAPGGGEELVDEYYRRSDHFNFARVGMPVVFFFSGVHEDYHRPTDTLEKIDRNKLRLMVDLICRMVTEVGNAPERPYEFKDAQAEGEDSGG